MADELQTDLIVRAIAEGFDKLSDAIDEPGKAADWTAKKISGLDKAMKTANKAVNGMKTAMGGAKIALAIVEQAFTFAAAEAEKLGRVDVVTNIGDAKNSLSGLADVLVQIPVGGRDFLQWMGDGAAGLANFARLVGALGIQAQLTFGIIDQETATQQINALVTDEAAASAEELTEAKDAATAASETQAKAEKRLQDVMKNTTGYKASQKAAGEAEKSLFDLRSEIQRLQAAQGKAAFSERDLAEMKLDVESATIDELEAARQLWNAQQDVTRAQEEGRGVTEEMTWATENARIAYERSRFASEDARVALESARNATVDNSAAIAELNDRLREETAGFYEAKQAALDYAEALGRVNDVRRLRQELGLPSFADGRLGGRQHGGSFAAGGAYFINESRATAPETVITQPGGGGTVLTRQQMEGLMGGRGGSNLSIGSVNLNNGMDLAEFKAMLRQAVLD